MGKQVAGYAKPRLNETATRARAGLLNILSATTLVLLIYEPQLDPVIYIAPFALFDMLAAAATGLTPLSPVGLLGTAITMRSRPLWVATRPKRFAWLIGALFAVICLSLRLVGAPTVALLAVVGICFVLTWLEAVLGFCAGCWMHRLFWGCDDCDRSYVPE